MTKKKRNKEYRRVYDVIDGNLNDKYGICLLLDKKQLFTSGYFPYRVYEAYPELALFKPENLRTWCESWFTDDKKGNIERLICLAFCIAMTE